MHSVTKNQRRLLKYIMQKIGKWNKKYKIVNRKIKE